MKSCDSKIEKIVIPDNGFNVSWKSVQANTGIYEVKYPGRTNDRIINIAGLLLFRHANGTLEPCNDHEGMSFRRCIDERFTLTVNG